MERCPNCRARCDGGAQCRRCGMDLTRLLAAERAAGGLITQAIERLSDDDPSAAIAALDQARGLFPDALADHLLAFARLRHQEKIGEHLQAIAQALRYGGVAEGLADILGNQTEGPHTQGSGERYLA